MLVEVGGGNYVLDEIPDIERWSRVATNAKECSGGESNFDVILWQNIVIEVRCLASLVGVKKDQKWLKPC